MATELSQEESKIGSICLSLLGMILKFILFPCPENSPGLLLQRMVGSKPVAKATLDQVSEPEFSHKLCLFL